MTPPAPKKRKPKKQQPAPAKKTSPKSIQKPKVRSPASAKPKPATSAVRPSTTAEQYHVAIAALKRGSATTHLLRSLGVHHPAGRVKELRDKYGYLIETTLVTSVDSDSHIHRNVALYTLVADPPQSELDFGRNAANDPRGGKQ